MSSEEAVMWEHEWVKCTKHLNQWDILSEFSRSTNNVELQIECSWKLPSWPLLKNLLEVYEAKSIPDIEVREVMIAELSGQDVGRE